MAINMFYLIFIILHLAIGLAPQGQGAHSYSSIGVCHGSLEQSPEEAVLTYKRYGINRIRLYEPEPSILHALRHSGIQVLLGVSNANIEDLAISYNTSKVWIEQNIMVYWPDVQFRYIAVGNQPVYLPDSNYVLKAMKKLYKVLTEFGLKQHIKISTVIGTSVIDTFQPPSAGSFVKHNNLFLTHIVHFLDIIGSPLLVNVFPNFIFVNYQNITLDYALFRSSEVVIKDGDMKYTNLFDTILDALHIAIKRVGAHRVSIVISATGWPFGGHQLYSSVDNAETYYSNLIRHVSSSQGTPMKRGINIETYLFSMFGIDKKLFTDTH